MYSRDEKVIEDVVDTMTDAGVAVSCNLTGHIWVNQSAAYSDFHVSGANPAGNANVRCGLRRQSFPNGGFEFQSRLRSRR